MVRIKLGLQGLVTWDEHTTSHVCAIPADKRGACGRGRCDGGAFILRKDTYLAQGIEDVVEVDENLSFGDLCNVVQGLARVISHPGILVGKAGQDRGHDNLEISRQLLWWGGGVRD